jgi:glycerol uptake facilitator-like aquaporin
MAHAGTTSTSTGQTGLWKALLAAVVIAAIFIGMVLAVPVITGKAASGPAVDNSYNLIEAQRGAALSGAPADTTYNAAEKARSGAFSGTTIDPSTYDRTPRGAHGQLP